MTQTVKAKTMNNRTSLNDFFRTTSFNESKLNPLHISENLVIEADEDAKDDKTQEKKSEDDMQLTKDEADCVNKLDQKEVKDKADKLDKKDKSKFYKVMGIIGNILKTTSDALIASNLDNFTLGNFKEAVCDIYKSRLKNMKQEELDAESKALHDMSGFDRAKSKAELSSRKDDNENSEIDESSATFNAIFWSKNDKENLLKIMNDLTVEIQKQGQKLTEEKKKVEQKIKAKKIDGIDETIIDAYGPIISQMIDDGSSNEEIQKKIKELASEVKESYDIRARNLQKSRMLAEGKSLMAEHQKSLLLLESICNTNDYIDTLTESLYNQGYFDEYLISEGLYESQEYKNYLIAEGLVDEGVLDKVKAGMKKAAGAAKDVMKKNIHDVVDIAHKSKEDIKKGIANAKDAKNSKTLKDKIKNSAKAAGNITKGTIGRGLQLLGKNAANTLSSPYRFAWKCLPAKYQDKLKGIVKNCTDKALKMMKEGSLAPILSIAGISVLILTGSWTIALIVATLTLIDRHGSRLKAAFDKYWDAFKNSNGVITKMNFSIKGHEDLKYSARYYVTDQTWRVLNLRNQSKTPSSKFAKEILTSDIGKKYINELIKKWDPVFDEDKGGKIDFKAILSQSKNIQISDKQLQMMDDFRKQYAEIKKSLSKPQIDTRAVSAKDAMAADMKQTKDVVDKVKNKVKSGIDKVKNIFKKK